MYVSFLKLDLVLWLTDTVNKIHHKAPSGHHEMQSAAVFKRNPIWAVTNLKASSALEFPLTIIFLCFHSSLSLEPATVFEEQLVRALCNVCNCQVPMLSHYLRN